MYHDIFVLPNDVVTFQLTFCLYLNSRMSRLSVDGFKFYIIGIFHDILHQCELVINNLIWSLYITYCDLANMNQLDSIDILYYCHLSYTTTKVCHFLVMLINQNENTSSCNSQESNKLGKFHLSVCFWNMNNFPCSVAITNYFKQ